MTHIARGVKPCKEFTELDEWEALTDWQANLQDKIERAFWCLNLLLLDGFSREDLNAFSAEVARFRTACAGRSWRQEAAAA
jgi:hypothetical protein